MVIVTHQGKVIATWATSPEVARSVHPVRQMTRIIDIGLAGLWEAYRG